MAAPACSARFERSAQICEAKCVVVTITGTRPATCFKHCVEHLVALGVGQHELLGEIGEDAEPVRAGVDHEVDGALLARRDRAGPRRRTPSGPPEIRPCRAAARWSLPWPSSFLSSYRAGQAPDSTVLNHLKPFAFSRIHRELCFLGRTTPAKSLRITCGFAGGECRTGLEFFPNINAIMPVGSVLPRP